MISHKLVGFSIKAAIVGSLAVVIGQTSYGQSDNLPAENIQTNPRKESVPGKKTLKSRKNPANTTKKARQKRNKTLLEAAKEAAVNNIFPSWPVPKFDWGFEPVAGLEINSNTVNDSSTEEYVASEFGLYGRAQAIPFDPNNPGILGHVGLGGAWGARGSSTSEPNGNTTDIDGYGYSRYWGHAGLTFLYHQFKNTTTVRRGILDTSEDNLPTTSLNGVTNDFGILFYSWISGHYTLDYYQLFFSNMSDPAYVETNHWIHAKMFTSYANAFLDFGPGFLDSEQKTGEFTNKQFSTYFLAKAGINPFWKLIAQARLKYIFEAEDSIETNVLIRSPDQGLNEPYDTALAADSMIVSAFAGFDNLFAGFGVGYQINLTILNVNEKNGSKKRTTRQQGLTMAYTANF